MTECDVLIVGGGPAGSSCAWGLRNADLDVVVMDRAQFPRDKTCAGWVTPPVWEMLQIDRAMYAARQTLQPITGFRTGMLGAPTVDTSYGEVVSYGIRRCEFDHYLLQRCGARLITGHSVHSIQRDGNRWLVNAQIRARVLVGAGGNFCPVARLLHQVDPQQPLVTAQEIEFEVEPQYLPQVAVDGDVPELYFCDDLDGYGWCFRKGNFLNIGLGHLRPEKMKSDLAELCNRLFAEERLGFAVPTRKHGHAYRLYAGNGRVAVGDAVLLIGDSAGLADPRSGEGIRPAVESGLAAARTLLQAAGDYRGGRLQPYADWLQQRFDGTPVTAAAPGWKTWLRTASGRALLRSRWFSRHILLDRWFLHRSNQHNIHDLV